MLSTSLNKKMCKRKKPCADGRDPKNGLQRFTNHFKLRILLRTWISKWLQTRPSPMIITGLVATKPAGACTLHHKLLLQTMSPCLPARLRRMPPRQSRADPRKLRYIRVLRASCEVTLAVQAVQVRRPAHSAASSTTIGFVRYA